MKHCSFSACIVIAIALLLFANTVHAQSYIDYSKYAGGSSQESPSQMQVVNGEAYTVGVTSSPNFPVTNGSIYRGGFDIVLTKYGTTGNVIYSTYIGGPGDDFPGNMQVINGEVLLTASTDSSGLPVTNGSSYHGEQDAAIIKVGATGNIIFCAYLGGSKNDYAANFNIQVANNAIYLCGTTSSPDFPVTDGGAFMGLQDGFIAKINAVNGNTLQCKYLGGNGFDRVNASLIDNNDLYVVGSSMSDDLPITLGTMPSGNNQQIMVYKLNESNLSIQYLRSLGGDKDEIYVSPQVSNGVLHLLGYTLSRNFPVTNGSLPGNAQFLDNDFDCFYTKLNPDGTIGYSTFLATDFLDFPNRLYLVGNETYIQFASLDLTNSISGRYVNFCKINSNGTFAYQKQFNVGYTGNSYAETEIINGEVFFAGITDNANYPVTNSNAFYENGTGYFTKLDAAGNVSFSTFLGKANNNYSPRIKYFSNKIYLLNGAESASYKVTDSSYFRGEVDHMLMLMQPNGATEFSGYIGGSNFDLATSMEVDNTGIYLYGYTRSVDYPVTNNVLQEGGADNFITKISFCPPVYNVASDTLSPKTQTVCQNGLAGKLTGIQIIIDSTTLPLIYRNGEVSGQNDITALYQWQKADAAAGPWINIPNATFKDYTPVIGNIPQYYRRFAFALPSCGNILLHTSDTAVVLVNSFIAPVVNAGGTVITCPGSAVTLGASPTASGGNPPFVSYEWDMGADDIANPVVSPNANTIYTLIVTDNAGCKQIGQSIVFVYRANAGIDKSNCAGNPVLIGGSPIAGNSGVQYNWQPATGLNSTTAPQPFANPAGTSNYVLTLTVPKTGGGTCITKDSVTVTPVAAPLQPNNAGPDKVLCLGDTLEIGTADELGFNYIWSPGFYLTSNITATTKYFPGNLLMPIPNPAVINLTAQKGGCSFADQVEVATIESRAGLIGCGPRMVGSPDRTPRINETYQWSLVSGPGSFLGPTNLPEVPVSASVGGSSVYGLTVTYNGHSCYSEVIVPESCNGCLVLIGVDAQYKCPSYGVNGGDVTLTALHGLQGDVTYRWWPQEGLSSYNSPVVKLTDNVSRTYLITVISALDTNIKCYGAIVVNDPAASIPVFNAADVTVCKDVPAAIGAAPVAGYFYEWTGTGLSNNYISNPTVFIPSQTSYSVRILDMAGCEIKDTVNVSVENVQVDAGQDWVICSNGVARLGTAATPNTTYLWEPQASPWQNGTDQNSAQPEVLLATDVTFTVTASTPLGCTTTDQVNVFINSSPSIPDYPDVTVCKSKSIQIGDPAFPGVTYQWTPATGLDNPNIAQPTASPESTTTYTVVANFPGACALPSSDQIIVTVSDPAFNIPDISYCPGNGPVALGNTAPSGMLTYYWNPYQLVDNYSIANASTVNPPPNIPTVFSLTVVNINGCFYTDSLILTPSLTAPVAGEDKTICLNTNTNIGSPANTTGAGITYSWEPSINLSDASGINPVFTGNTPGTFIYVLSKTVSSCASKDTIIITVKDSVVKTINSPVICQNSCVQIGTTPAAGVQYQWNPATGLSNATIANPIACIGTASTSYTLSGRDASGCTGQQSIVIGVTASPAPLIIIPPVNACVGDANIQFNPIIAPAGAYNFLWSPNDGSLSDIAIENPTIIIAGTGTRQYSLEVTNTVSGCINTATGSVTSSICPVLATVGDLLWFDVNADGIQDAGEQGVSNMLTKLYNSAGVNVASAVTDANGFYSFSNVQPDTGYYVIFSKPVGYSFTIQNIGGIAALNNSKADASGRTGSFAIPSGASILNIDAGIKPTGATPVMLLSFTGRLQNNHTVLLNWQTTAEHNNDYFDVERSSDGINFVSIGRVKGYGTTSLPHSYPLVDSKPINGLNYYRLRQVDFDGHYIYSNIVQVEVKNKKAITALYNSQSNSIAVHFSDIQNNTVLKLFAANGQLIKSVAVKNNNNCILDLPMLASGIYMLQAMSNNDLYSEKILIRH